MPVRWYDATTAADTTALETCETDLVQWNTAADEAWQAEVDSVLSAVDTAVGAWASQSGTRFANLLDTELSAWIDGTKADAAAAVDDDEATFESDVQDAVTVAEEDDTEADREADRLPATIRTEAEAAVSELESDAQAMADAVATEDREWQQDEHQAAADALTRDQDEAEAAVLDADADQDAEQAWERSESAAVAADQKAVDAEDARAAKEEADATKAAMDKAAAGRQTQEKADAEAAKKRDKQVAAVRHDMVVADAGKVAAAVAGGAAQADTKAKAAVQTAATDALALVDVELAKFREKIDAWVINSIANHDTEMAKLVESVQTKGAEAVQAAEDKLQQDTDTPASDKRFLINPTPAESDFQIAYDYLPKWETVAAIGVVVVASAIVPGAGTVIAVAGAGMLGYSFGSGATKRYFDDDQTMAGALLGSSADVTGVTSVYGALTDRDIGTGEHLDLTPAQQRERLTEGGIQLAGTVLAVGQAGRSFFGNRSGAAGAKPNNGTPQANGSKATPPAEAVPPAKPAGSSNAGKSGTAEAAECATPPGCFAAGVPVLCEDGDLPIEAVQAGMRVWARDENDPVSPPQLRLVEEVFVRHSLIWELELDNGVVIQSTAEHPFWVVGRGWVDVHEIAPGDRFIGRDCREIPVVDIRDTGRLEQVYNFRVAESHTYFVGGLAWGCDVWTHNTCSINRKYDGPIHHIASDKGSRFPALFQVLFEKAGLSIQSPWNRMRVEGHVGPHGSFYNQLVLNRLTVATEGTSGVAFRRALIDELKSIRWDIRHGGWGDLLKAAASKVDRLGIF